MGLLEYLNAQKEAAMRDYSGLIDHYPNVQKFSQSLLTSLDPHFPKAEDYDIQHPERMRDWSMSVFESGAGGIPANFLKPGMIK